MSILIVDDSLAERTIIKDILEDGGYNDILSVASAEEAFQNLCITPSNNRQLASIDIILLDIIMPGTDGFAALERIKADTSSRDIPVIMVTARTGEEDIKEAFDRGAVDFIGKPFNKTELLSRVRSALRLKEEIDRRRLHEQKLKEEIWERKRVEETLRSFEKAIENMQIGVTITDTSGRILYVNPAEAQMHGYDIDELKGLDAKIFAPSKLWNPMTKEKLRKLGSLKRDSINIRKDGSIFPVRLLSDAVRTDDGEVAAIVTTCEDITERKRQEEELKAAHDELEKRVLERTEELSSANMALKEEVIERRRIEETLRESENSYRKLTQQFDTLLEAIPDSLILLSPSLEILWANHGARRVYGVDKDLTGMNCADICSRENDECPASKSFRSRDVEGTQLKTGTGRTIEIRAFPIKDRKGKVVNVIEVAKDVTEELALRTEAMRSAHLASIGELSAGVAHEINNPINGIINCAQILIDRLGDRKRENEIAEMIIVEGKRISGIVQALLSFARERKEKKGPINLNDVLKDSLALTSAHLRKDGISLKTDFPDDLPAVTGHHQQIQQVFLNLINNAHYALKGKALNERLRRELSITASEFREKRKNMVRVIFLDNGAGIPAGIIDKVMDPFFSTKPHDKGTGLGLSISHGIISDHDGKIRIESKEGEYTRVIVDLPAGG